MFKTEVARNINHSLKSVERYLQHFSRCVFLARKQFTPLQVAMTIGISSKCANDYLELYRDSKELELRLPEIDSIGAQHYVIEDAKKGILTSSASSTVEEN
ncbi:hypothetical protein BVY04_03365 [bacterium M21]|nr:hypothetical protein BVY04_03365 [bacterium M21]